MSFIGSMLGVGGSNDFHATGVAEDHLMKPVQDQQLAGSLGNAESMGQQGQLLAGQLQGQNGIANQSSVYNQLAGVASGQGPNPAQLQFQNNAANIAAQTAGLMGSQKGMSPALQARMVAQQGAGAQQQMAGQSAQALAQQQLGAMGAMGNIANTQVGNQMSQVNANTAAAQNQYGMQLGAVGNYNNANAGMLSGINNVNSASALQTSKAQQGMFGGLLGGAGSILSDENAKTNVQSASGKVHDFLDHVGAHEYSYKASVQGHPGTAPGRHTGPMAQELEQSELGKQMVINTPDGKGVDFQRGLGTIIASMGELNKRLDAIEGGRSQKMAQGGEVGGASWMPMYAGGGDVLSQSLPLQGGGQQGPQSMAGRMFSGMGQGVASVTIGGNQQQSDNYNPVHAGSEKLFTNLAEKYVKPLFHSTAHDALDTANAPVDTGVGAPITGGSVQSSDILPDTLAPAEGVGTAAGATEGTEAAEGIGTAAGAAEGAEAAEGLESLGSLGELAAALAHGGSVGKKLKNGGKVPGKAKFKGDNYANDTVSAKLSPGEVVIPNSIMQGPDPANHAAAFVAAIMTKKGRGLPR